MDDTMPDQTTYDCGECGAGVDFFVGFTMEHRGHHKHAFTQTGEDT